MNSFNKCIQIHMNTQQYTAFMKTRNYKLYIDSSSVWETMCAE